MPSVNLRIFSWRSCCLAATTALILFCVPTSAAENAAVERPDEGLTPIVFQLRWLHQFQFAGYYAAVEKGFYREAGFDVTLLEGSPKRNPIDEVLAGRALYAEGNSGILFRRLQGAPLVVLAAVFQHSPTVLLAKKDSGISTPQDLIGRRVMLLDGVNDADLLAMLQNEGVSLDKIERLESSYNIEDLIEGKTDAFNAYTTNEPYYLEERGIPVSVIHPKTYGIDFYSDVLFTTEEEVKKHPDRVRRFREASLLGWEYAMANPEEMIDIILTKYSTKKTQDHLRFEAAAMRKLIMPDIIQIGHMNPGRWKHMADTFVSLGMVEGEYNLEGFVYDPSSERELTWLRWILGTLLVALVAVGFSVLVLLVFNSRLRKAVYQRTAEQERINHELANEVSQRKQAQEALEASESRYRELYDNAPVGYHQLDAEGRIVRINRTELDMLGYAPEEVIGKPIWEFVVEKEESRVSTDGKIRGEIRPGQAFERTYKRKDGTSLPVLIEDRILKNEKGEIIGIRSTLQDITERKRAENEKQHLESQIQHAQKLESLGVLAGGIAHDFNNLLMGILGNADLALMGLSPVSPIRENLEDIEKASLRAADLCKQMLAYSGKGRFVIESIDLNELVREMAHILEVSISKRATLRRSFQEDLPLIEADATQVRQVVMNLITNASEALGDKDGVISITTGVVECDRKYLLTTYLDEELPEGRYVSLEVSDTGCGMDQETQKKLFDPFFTTKFLGRGLGMAAAIGIMRGHRGAIKVYSEVGKGTSLKVLFPALPSGDPATLSLLDQSQEATLNFKGSGTILFVDDEETVSAVGRRMLEHAGFAVITATDGRQAVEMFREIADEVVCVVLDLTMPHMDGEEAFRELRRIRPDIRVILSSGYNQQDVTQRFAGKGLAGFVQKPYQFTDLINELSRVLGGERSA